MEENHNDITELSVSAPEAVDTEKTEKAGTSSQPEAAADREKPAKPELKKPAFLEEKKPEPYKKTTLSFLKGVNTAQEPSAPAEKAAEEAPSAESEPPAVAVPTEKSELPVNPTSHVSWNTDELPIIEDVLGIEEAAEEEPAEPVPAEEPMAEEPVAEETAEVFSAEEPELPVNPTSHISWNTDELPVIEDVLEDREKTEGAEQEEAPAETFESESEETPAETSAEVSDTGEKTAEASEKDAAADETPAEKKTNTIRIPFFGGEKDEEDEEEEDSAQDEEQDEEAEEKGQEEERKFSLKMPSGSLKRILIAGVVILAIILIYSLIQSRRIYHSYEVMSAVVSSDDASTSYQVNKYGMIRYSNNGIALTDKSGNVIWNQTYEMNNPIITSAGRYIAAGDRGASTLYIFNQYGQCGKLTTDLPIQGMQMAENGVVAAILSDSESNFINLYDKQGERLVGIRATLENTGYPLAVGISPDASRVVVSYLMISESATVQTKLVFYDFSAVNGEHEKLTGIINSLCPRIQFLGQQRVAVFREKGFDIYSVDGEVKMVFSTEFEDEIRSIFNSEQKLGFVFRNRDDNGKFRIELYDVSGQKSMTLYSNLDYTDLNADSDEVILYNSSRAEIYKYNGKQVFDGTFENRITAMMPSWDTGMYWLVEDSRLSEVRVK